MSSDNRDLKEGIRLVRSGQVSEALWHLRMAIVNEPGNPVAHEYLGAAFAYEQDTESAILEMQEAVRLNPRNAAYRYNLGQILEIAGRVAEARLEYETALRLSPTYARALTAFQRVSKHIEPATSS